jgi:hypothetical protein
VARQGLAVARGVLASLCRGFSFDGNYREKVAGKWLLVTKNRGEAVGSRPSIIFYQAHNA